jgi:hypothetical protein
MNHNGTHKYSLMFEHYNYVHVNVAATYVLTLTGQ